MAKKTQVVTFFGFSCLLLLLTPSYSQTNKLEQGQSTGELTSANGIFKLGFTSLKFSGSVIHTYLRIYYAGAVNNTRVYVIKEASYLWIGNRDNPIINNTATLTIDGRGSLKIIPDGGDNPIVVFAVRTLAKTGATLENSGNLVLYEKLSDGSTQVLWESFNHPTNVLLPGMKLGMNQDTRQNWSLISWRSEVSPAKGSFTLGVDPHARDQLVSWWKGDVYWRSGPWKKEGGNLLSEKSNYIFNYISNENEAYFNISVGKVVTPFPMLVLTEQGMIEDEQGSLVKCLFLTPSSSSRCMKKKLPKCSMPRYESVHDYNIQKGFMSAEGFKFAESGNLSVVDCKANCLRRCSCVAYASTNADNTGCEIWNSRAIFKSSEMGRKIYIPINDDVWWAPLVILVGGVVIIVPVVSMILAICLKCQGQGDGVWNEKMILRELGSMVFTFSNKKSKNRREEGNELRIFSFEMVVAATDYFSRNNKLGEGGYGPVYKGKLPDGQEIAIKRLSRSSGQGLVEFMNEATLIAKLQHTNLVRLFGFCIQGEEKILVYEYMQNKSLDFFLFDSDRRSILNWRRRFAIIEGIAQGLLYLHKYSRLRVIHRDLKASNILLDDEMNPKISDFGLARIFGVQETEANTNRVVGTHGYMSPEYAFQGIVSIKTDVFSFGVLLLEIISGKKNHSLYRSDRLLNLIGYAWQLWNEGRALELMDPELEDESGSHNEILRCIHVGLLCVQDNATDRPNMLDVVSMLTHQSILIPAPKQPAFFFGAVLEAPDMSEKNAEACSINQVSITVMEAR